MRLRVSFDSHTFLTPLTHFDRCIPRKRALQKTMVMQDSKADDTFNVLMACDLH